MIKAFFKQMSIPFLSATMISNCGNFHGSEQISSADDFSVVEEGFSDEFLYPECPDVFLFKTPIHDASSLSLDSEFCCGYSEQSQSIASQDKAALMAKLLPHLAQSFEPQDVPRLLSLLERQDVDVGVKINVIHAFKVMGPKAESALPVLKELALGANGEDELVVSTAKSVVPLLER